MPTGKAPKEAPQAAPASSGDSISSLPDEILHRVLSFLPAQQVVRTCVLALRWRHLWKSATSLSIVGVDGKAPVLFEEIREFVDGLLLLRGSSPLEKFELNVAGAAIDVPHVRLWVMYAVQCKVQVLRLSFHGNTLARLRPEDPPLASTHLTHLELRGLVFNHDFLDFSRCPKLQRLKIQGCNLEHAERISSQLLRHLSITICRFKNMPMLVKATVGISGLSKDCCSRSNYGDCGDRSCGGCIRDDSASVILDGMSQAKSLVFLASPETFIFRRDLKLCPIFNQLKSLAHNEYWCVPDEHPIACILEHSPVLENLILNLEFKPLEARVAMKGMFNPKELPPTISPHLKRVRIICSGLDGNGRVLKVLKFLSKLNISFSFP